MQILWVGGYQAHDELSLTNGWNWGNDEGLIPGHNFGDRYANWVPGEPNGYWGPASENHMVIGWMNGGGWNDQRADGAQGYVVEFDLPAPSQLPPPEKMATVALRLEPSPLANHL